MRNYASKRRRLMAEAVEDRDVDFMTWAITAVIFATAGSLGWAAMSLG